MIVEHPTEAEREQFAIDLTDRCATREEWLGVVRFGLPTLLGNAPLLLEVLVRRAEVERRASPVASRCVADEARALLRELHLTIARDGFS